MKKRITKREFYRFLEENKKQFKKASDEFDEHSRKFDQLIRAIRAGL